MRPLERHGRAVGTTERRSGRRCAGWLLMRGLGGFLDCLDAQHHVVCPVCVPPGRGDCLCVFVPCFPSSM